MTDDLVKQWDNYVEIAGGIMGEAEELAQNMRDRIEALTAERDRAIDDARDNAEYVDLVSLYRAERDEYKRSAAHSEDVVRAARVEIERLKQEVDQFRRFNDGLQDAMLAAEADNARLRAELTKAADSLDWADAHLEDAGVVSANVRYGARDARAALNPGKADT
jgi:chromosome segregation ATPase